MATGIFHPSQLGGGGGVNSIALERTATSLASLLIGAGCDISGIDRSIDGGKTWEAGKGGDTDESPAMGIGALFCDRVNTTAGTLWFWKINKNGLLVSTDGLKSWVFVSASATFGNANGQRPRSVGRLFAQDSTGILYFTDGTGIWRYKSYNSTTGLGGTMVQIASASSTVTGIDIDNDDTKLYISTLGNPGAAVITGSIATATAGAATITNFTNAPAACEDIQFVNQGGTKVVYVVNSGASPGAYRSASNATSAAFTSILSGASDWCSIAAWWTGSVTECAVGCHGGVKDATTGLIKQVFFSANADTTHTFVCWTLNDGNMAFVNSMGGPGGQPFWGLFSGAQGGSSGNNLTQDTGFTPEQMEFMPGNHNYVFCCGTQGVWMFDRAAKKCYPMHDQLAVTANNEIRIDPQDDTRIMVANIDHVDLMSTDADLTWIKNNLGISGFAQPAGWYLDFDRLATPSQVWLAPGERDLNTKGDVMWHQDPFPLPHSTPWTSMGFNDALTASGGGDSRVLGLSVRRVAGKIIVLVATSGRGMWRAVFDPSGVAPPPPPGGIVHGGWPGNSGLDINILTADEATLGTKFGTFRERGGRGGLNLPIYKNGMNTFINTHPGAPISVEFDAYLDKSTPVSNFTGHYADVLNGQYDTQIDARADELNALPNAVVKYCELQSEANLASHNSGTAAQAKQYQAYVVNRWTNKNVHNVLYICSLTGSQWDTDPNPWVNYAVIDVLANDAYVDFTSNPTLQRTKTMQSMFSSVKNHAAAHGKKWAITEHGVQEDPTNANFKADFYTAGGVWLASLAAAARPEFIMWNESNDGSGGWRFDSSTKAKNAFKALIS